MRTQSEGKDIPKYTISVRCSSKKHFKAGIRFLKTYISEFPCTLVWFYRETAFLFALPFVYYGIIRFPIQGNVDWCRRIVSSYSFVSFLISSFSFGAERRIVKESSKKKKEKKYTLLCSLCRWTERKEIDFFLVWIQASRRCSISCSLFSFVSNSWNRIWP